MSLNFKRVVFISLVVITIGFGIGSIFFPPLAAIAGWALLVAIAIGKSATSPNQEVNKNNNSNPGNKPKDANPAHPPQIVPVPGQHLHFSYKHTKSPNSDVETYTLDVENDSSPEVRKRAIVIH